MLARRFRLALEELGPTFVKLGQVLSTRPDLLPPAFISELSRLQDQVPPESWEVIRAVFIEELGAPPEELFAGIDPQPLAAASLSQVHAATLMDGREVVVKVQRPGITPLIETDLQILHDLATAAQHSPAGELYDLPAIAEDFAATLRAELDYRREGRNADRFRENFADEDQLYIPRVYWHYSSRRVLVLERIHGIKIDDVAAMEAAGIDRKAVALHSAQIIVKEVLEDGFFHADPHAGNYMVMPGEVIGAMDFGMVGYVDDRLRLDLVRLYAAAINFDAEAIVDQLARMYAIPENANRRALASDITRLLHKYRGMKLKEIRATEAIEDIFPIAFRHRLALPSDLWLLAKTLNMMEGIGLQLDPDFDIFNVSGPIVGKLISRVFLPRQPLKQRLVRLGTDWGDVAELLPRAGTRLLQQAERGELFTLRLKDADEFFQRMDLLVTRLSLSLLIAGLTVGLAVLVPAIGQNALARAMALIGFVLSAGLTAWFAFSILKPRKRRPGRGG